MLEKTFSINMLTAQSRMVRHLQLADLVVSITAAMFAGQTKWASQYFELIKGTFIRNALGYIGGTGVKVYPDELINLYYWVLGEKQFSKAGRGLRGPYLTKISAFAPMTAPCKSIRSDSINFYSSAPRKSGIALHMLYPPQKRRPQC
ncbi:MAG: hypothetical protein Q8L89_08465 [Gammaproteobacteria bacterium]|nr:hypothetical protein [Gammaproteobacteria bacterium]